MIDWIVLAKMSVPPPAPAVTTNSTGLSGSKASAGVAAPRTAAKVIAVDTEVLMDIPPFEKPA
jgi:hypothetical protein